MARSSSEVQSPHPEKTVCSELSRKAIRNLQDGLVLNQSKGSTVATELRRTGISVVGEVPWGTHFCTFYETTQDLLDILVPFFKAGLENKEFCLWIISNSELLTVEEARNALRSVRTDFDGDLSVGRIELVSHDQWFLDGDGFDSERVAHRFKEKLKHALAQGYAGMRVNGSPAWLYKYDDKELVNFERGVDKLYPNLRVIACCTYPIRKSDAGVLLDVAEAHRFVITRRHGNWEVLETPELMQAKQEIQRLNQELEQRVIERNKKPEDTTARLRAEIEERREAEEALRESETKLKQAQQLAHVGYWERDLLADRITWSKETGRILGLESFRGVPNQAQLRKFIHPDDWQHHQEVFNEALQGSRLFDVEVRVVRPDGNIRFVHIRDEIVRDESGKALRMFGAVQDITERKEAEEAVRRSEEHLRLVIDTIPTMAWTVRPDGVVDFLNQRWQDYAGLSLEQYAKDPTSPIHPDDVPRTLEKWRTQIAIGEGYEDEMRLRRADGEYRWFLVRTEPLHDERGRIIKWYGVSTDIEDRKRAELEARTLINAIPVQIWSGPPDGTNDYLNERWRAETGLAPKDMRGDGWQTLIHPGDRDRVLKAWQYSVQTGTPYEQEERHRIANGTYRWYLNRGVPLRNDQGRIIRWYGSNTDIEDRKQAEEKLKHSEVQLAQAQRLAHIGSWDWDLRTNAVTWSEELYHIFGLKPGTISVAGDVDQFIHPDDLDLGWDTVRRAVASREPYDYYHRILRPDGTERIARSRGSIVSDERGKPIRVFGATQDVTELKRAEEKLKETGEQLRALSASVQSAREEESKRMAREIHDELGGALTSWKWDLEEIRDEMSITLDASQVVTVRNKIEGMIKFTETMLDTVRRLASELRPAALELGLVQGLEWQVLQFENRTGIPAQLDCALEKVDLDNGQATAVFRILQEALTNIQRHAEATRVTVACWEESDRFILTIKDNGRGITESEKSDLQSLGLLGMRERAHLSGGEINIESAAGEGTKITLRIPISS